MSKKNNQQKMVIYLLDLAHTQTVQNSSIPVPLGIGFIAAYLDEMFGEDVEVKLFKHPEKALKNILTDRPTIVGFSNYGWNQNLNLKVGQYIRNKLPESLLVAGGPNIDNDPALRTEFLTQFDFLDYAIINGGEEPFSELVKWQQDTTQKIAIPSNLIWLEDGVLNASPERGMKKVIDNIPSPYLSGHLDEFLADGLIPLFETNRGCPFQCTFCAWGMASHDLVRRFEIEVVIKEIEYVGSRSNARNWIFCDANFGILKRDIDIAKAIMKNKERYGSPSSCHIWLSKNTIKRNLEIAEIMGDVIVPCMAVQSMDDEVLKNIKRDNITLDTYTEYHNKFHQIGSLTYSDMIVPLPAETLESHMKGVAQLMDLGVDIIMNHNMRLLAGAETNSVSTRNKFSFTTKYRLIHGDAGRYETPDGDSICAFEYEESLRSTSSMSEDEVYYLRKLHFLVDFCWNLDVYKPLLKLLVQYGTNPLVLLQKIIDTPEQIGQLSENIRQFWCEFNSVSHDEWFESSAEIERYFLDEHNFEKLLNQEYEKLNILSSVKVLQGYKKEFDSQLSLCAKEMLPEHADLIDDVMKVVSVTFPSLDDLTSEREIDLSHILVNDIDSVNKIDTYSRSNKSSKIRLYESDRRQLAKSVINGSKGKTLSKILNTQGIGLSDLKYSIDQGFGYGREAKQYFQPH